MKRTIRLSCACAALLISPLGLRAADTLEEVEKKLIEAAEKNKTMTARMVSTMEMEGAQMKMKSKQEGTLETARRGEKYLSRSEAKSTGTNKFGDQPEQKIEEKSLAIFDGDYLYTYSEGANGKQAFKMKADTTKQGAVSRRMFDDLRKGHELKLLPEEKVDGRACYVIEATPRKAGEGVTQKNTFWYDKESAVVMKMVFERKDANARTNSTTVMSEVKLGVDIKPERFVFKAPDGVEVVDMDKMREDAARGSGTASTGGERTETATAEKAKSGTDEKSAEKKDPPKEEKKPLLPKIKLR